MSRRWEVAVIVDPACDPGTVSTLSGYMPVWVVDTPGNAASIATAWSHKRDCTSFKVFDTEDRVGNLLSNLGTIVLHHPGMTLLHILGLESTEQLTTKLAIAGFAPARKSWFEAISFRRLHLDWTGARTLLLDATDWKTADDVWNALFLALESPSWHGRNFSALNDSIMTGQINEVEPPFRLSIEGIEHAGPDAKAFTDELINLFQEFENRGCPVSIVEL